MTQRCPPKPLPRRDESTSPQLMAMLTDHSPNLDAAQRGVRWVDKRILMPSVMDALGNTEESTAAANNVQELQSFPLIGKDMSIKSTQCERLLL